MALLCIRLSNISCVWVWARSNGIGIYDKTIFIENIMCLYNSIKPLGEWLCLGTASFTDNINTKYSKVLTSSLATEFMICNVILSMWFPERLRDFSWLKGSSILTCRLTISTMYKDLKCSSVYKKRKLDRLKLELKLELTIFRFQCCVARLANWENKYLSHDSTGPISDHFSLPSFCFDIAPSLSCSW